jgi:hypothetical protein
VFDSLWLFFSGFWSLVYGVSVKGSRFRVQRFRGSKQDLKDGFRCQVSELRGVMAET